MKIIDLIVVFLMILGSSWVENGSTKRARKATSAPRRALGTGMEAKCSNMEQKVKTSNFIKVFLRIVGASWVENGSTKRARKATPAPRRALGTGMEAKCSNMEQKVKTNNVIKVCLMILGASLVENGSTKRARKDTRASRRAFGAGMEAKCSIMEQNVKTINFIMICLMICGASLVENGSTKRAREATRAPRRALETGMEAKRSNMEQKAKNIDFTKVFGCFLMILGVSCVDKGSTKRARQATRAPRIAF